MYFALFSFRFSLLPPKKTGRDHTFMEQETREPRQGGFVGVDDQQTSATVRAAMLHLLATFEAERNDPATDDDRQAELGNDGLLLALMIDAVGERGAGLDPSRLRGLTRSLLREAIREYLNGGHCTLTEPLRDVLVLLQQ
jgi:hypothetical protein